MVRLEYHFLRFVSHFQLFQDWKVNHLVYNATKNHMPPNCPSPQLRALLLDTWLADWLLMFICVICLYLGASLCRYCITSHSKVICCTHFLSIWPKAQLAAASLPRVLQSSIPLIPSLLLSREYPTGLPISNFSQKHSDLFPFTILFLSFSGARC